MLYLLLFVTFVVTFTQGLRYAQRRGAGVLPISAVNYVAAAVVSAGILAWRWGGLPAEGRATAAGLGAASGVGYVTCLLFLLGGYRLAGIGITTAFMQMGVTIPVLVSFGFWGEKISPFQWGALGLLPVAMVLMRPAGGGHTKLTLAGDAVLIGALLVNGTVGTIHKASNVYAGGCVHLYQAVLFSAAAVACMAYVAARHIPYGRRVAVLGTGLGVANVMATLCCLLALSVLPAGVVFPISSSLTIAASVILGRVLWKEHVNARQIAGVAIAMIVVILANLQAG